MMGAKTRRREEKSEMQGRNRQNSYPLTGRKTDDMSRGRAQYPEVPSQTGRSANCDSKKHRTRKNRFGGGQRSSTASSRTGSWTPGIGLRSHVGGCSSGKGHEGRSAAASFILLSGNGIQGCVPDGSPCRRTHHRGDQVSRSPESSTPKTVDHLLALERTPSRIPAEFRSRSDEGRYRQSGRPSRRIVRSSNDSEFSACMIACDSAKQEGIACETAFVFLFAPSRLRAYHLENSGTPAERSPDARC